MNKYWSFYSFSEGVFGAHMVVSIENDGPVTLTFESPQSSSNTVEGST